MADFDAQTGRKPHEELSAARCEADEIDLQAGLAGVTGIVAGARPVDDLLALVAGFAAHAIPATDGVGISMARFQHDAIEIHSATADFVSVIERAQFDELHEGPCITCMQSRRATVSGSLGSDSRWPHFGGRAARMSVHSVLALPLVVDGQVIGAINTRDAFGEHAVALGSRFAATAAVSVYNAQLLANARDRTEGLQHALTSRAVIDQAIGIIRARTGVDAEDAFKRLRQLSQSDNVKLTAIAERLVDEAVRRARARHRP